MAIINSRPLTTEHLNDPTNLEPLPPNHILMKSKIILLPPGQFVSQAEDYIYTRDGARCHSWQMNFDKVRERISP